MEILDQERFIEEIENKKQEVMDEMKAYNALSLYPTTAITYGAFFSLSPLLSKFVINNVYGPEIYNEVFLSRLFGNMKLGHYVTLLAVLMLLPPAIIGSIVDIKQIRENRKKVQAYKAKLYYLTNRLNMEKELLKTGTNTINIRTNYGEELEQIINESARYFNIGYSIKKYAKLLETGGFDKALIESYGDSIDIEDIRKYIDNTIYRKK